MDEAALRQVLLSKALRRSVFVALLAISVWFVYRSLEQGSWADGCAGSLTAAIASGDSAYLAEHVRNPSLEQRLLRASVTELAFVRPVDRAWSRIGLLVRDPATTTSTAVFILLSHEHTEHGCSFIQDYDGHL